MHTLSEYCYLLDLKSNSRGLRAKEIFDVEFTPENIRDAKEYNSDIYD